MLIKTNLWVYQRSFLRLPLFRLRREVLCEFPRKCFKTKEKHSLPVCGSLWGEKLFLLEFVPIYWFDQKQLFKKILILLRLYPFQTCLEKQTF